MGRAGVRRIRSLSAIQILVLGAIGGAFITVGALFSLLLGAGVHSPGPQRLLEGLGFSAGFFFVILSEAALFTEANVALPATLLRNSCDAPAWRVARFWALAWLGNLLGAFVTGLAIHAAQRYSSDVNALLRELVAKKMS
jgi:formate transporter